VARRYQHDTPETGKDPPGGFYRQRGHAYDLRLRPRARLGVWPRTVRRVHLDQKTPLHNSEIRKFASQLYRDIIRL
jgi:hypothetical protein